jgi:hypothetical protein
MVILRASAASTMEKLIAAPQWQGISAAPLVKGALCQLCPPRRCHLSVRRLQQRPPRSLQARAPQLPHPLRSPRAAQPPATCTRITWTYVIPRISIMLPHFALRSLDRDVQSFAASPRAILQLPVLARLPHTALLLSSPPELPRRLPQQAIPRQTPRAAQPICGAAPLRSRARRTRAVSGTIFATIVIWKSSSLTVRTSLRSSWSLSELAPSHANYAHHS